MSPVTATKLLAAVKPPTRQDRLSAAMKPTQDQECAPDIAAGVGACGDDVDQVLEPVLGGDAGAHGGQHGGEDDGVAERVAAGVVRQETERTRPQRAKCGVGRGAGACTCGLNPSG